MKIWNLKSFLIILAISDVYSIAVSGDDWIKTSSKFSNGNLPTGENSLILEWVGWVEPNNFLSAKTVQFCARLMQKCAKKVQEKSLLE